MVTQPPGPSLLVDDICSPRTLVTTQVTVLLENSTTTGIMARPAAVTIGAHALGGHAALNINRLVIVVPLVKPATLAHTAIFVRGITPATAAFKDLTVLI